MIVYEVNCLIDETVAEEFEVWLVPHINQILSLEGFLSAETETLLEDDRLEEKTNRKGVSVRYKLSSRDALENYYIHHAGQLREEGRARFGEKLSVYRRVLQPV